MKAVLLDDVLSCFGGKVYGYAGEEVNVISDHMTVFIVESENGRFPARKDQVSIKEGE